jgi:exosome complex component RRP42
MTIEALILADSGNIHDAIFVAIRAALWDTRVPKTRSVEFRSSKETENDSFSAAVKKKTVDFELADYWDDGEPFLGRENLPICLTLNIVPPTYFLDATPPEENSVPTRIIFHMSFPPSKPPMSHGIRLLGPNEVSFSMMEKLLKESEKYGRELAEALNRMSQRLETNAGSIGPGYQ